MFKLEQLDNPDYLILSDFHLGDKSGADDFNYNYFKKIKQAEDTLIRNIKLINPKVIILAGDIFELAQFEYDRIVRLYRKLLQYLLEEKCAILLKGNHDRNLSFGKDQIVITLPNNKNVLITHGHQNDKSMGSWYQSIALHLLKFVEMIMPGIDNLVVRYLDEERQGAYPKAKDYAEELLLRDDVDYVVLGHTHIHEILQLSNGKTYLNSGTCQNGRFEGVIIDGNNIDLIKL